MSFLHLLTARGKEPKMINNANVKYLSIFAPLKRTLPKRIYCGVEQLVARWAHNPKVIGSSPVPATTPLKSMVSGAFFMPKNNAFPLYSCRALTLQKLSS